MNDVFCWVPGCFLKSLGSGFGLLVFLSLVNLFMGISGLEIAILGVAVLAIGFDRRDPAVS